MVLKDGDTTSARRGRSRWTLQKPRPRTKGPSVRHHPDLRQIRVRHVVDRGLADEVVDVHGNVLRRRGREADAALDVRLHQRSLRPDAQSEVGTGECFERPVIPPEASEASGVGPTDSLPTADPL